MAKMTKATLLRYLEEHKESLERAVRGAIFECRDEMIFNSWDYSNTSRITDGLTMDDDDKPFHVYAPIYICVQRDSVDYSRMVANWCIAGEDIPYEPRELVEEFDVKDDEFNRRKPIRKELKELLDCVNEIVGAVTEVENREEMLNDLYSFLDYLPLYRNAIEDALLAYRRKK